MRSTRLREHRSCDLMHRDAGRHTVDTLIEVLRDHQGYPVSICRHGEDAVTGFSVVFEPEARHFWYAQGRPCQQGYSAIRY